MIFNQTLMNSGSSNGGFTIPLLPLKMVKNDNRYGIRIITSPITRDRAEGGAGGGFSPPTFLQE